MSDAENAFSPSPYCQIEAARTLATAAVALAMEDAPDDRAKWEGLVAIYLKEAMEEAAKIATRKIADVPVKLAAPVRQSSWRSL